MRIECNLNDVKEIEVLPSNVYSVRCIAVPENVVSSQKKTPGFQLKIQFLDPGTEIAPGVPRVWANNETTGWKGADMGWQHFKIKEMCEAFRVPFDEKGFDTEHFFNAEAKVAVGQESYDKKDGTKGVKNTIEHWLKA